MRKLQKEIMPIPKELVQSDLEVLEKNLIKFENDGKYEFCAWIKERIEYKKKQLLLCN
jgi:hypothetical protein